MLTKELALVAPLVVYLNILHGVGRQVVEHDGMVASEEVLAVQKQGVDILPVMVDAAALLQFYAWQLAYQRVEH